MTEALQQEIRTLRALYQSERDPAGRVFAPLADAYRRAGQVPEALRLLKEGLPKHPDFVTGHVVAAQLYVEQGLAEEGAMAARRALALDGDNVWALQALLRALQEKGEAAEAVGARERLTALDPDFDWETAVVARAAAPTRPFEPVAPEAVAMAVPEVAAPAPEPDEVGLIERDEDFGGFALVSDEPPSGATMAAPDEPTAKLAALTPDPEPVLELDHLGAVSIEGLDIPTAPLEAGRWSALAPDPEPVFDVGSLGPPGLQATIFAGLTLPAEPEEPVLDMAALAPEAEEEPVLDMARLAPEAEEEPVLDMAALAPEAEEEPVLDMAALAPEAEEEEPVLDMARLAPEADEEPVLDMAALAPEAEDEPVLDMARLAPDSGSDPAGGTTMDDGPDDIVIDLDALRPSPSRSGADDVSASDAASEDASADEVAPDDPSIDESEEGDDAHVPLYTRTLAELYVKQGAVDRALVVLRHLRETDPRDHEVAQRIAELERGDVAVQRPASTPEPEREEEVETLARDLAHSGRAGHEVDTPFAWAEDVTEEAPSGPTMREYFDGMLAWEPGEEP